jgi:hypothetical protein
MVNVDYNFATHRFEGESNSERMNAGVSSTPMKGPLET